MNTGKLLGFAIGMFILTPLLNRLLRKPIGRLLNRHGYDLNGKKKVQSSDKESDTNGSADYMPRTGDTFEGKIINLKLKKADADGWKRRDISFFKHDEKRGENFKYPTQHDQIILIDTDGDKYELNFSKPESEKTVCLGTPSRLKPWYRKKRFDDQVIGTNDRLYFEYTGNGIEFFVFTEDEYRLIKNLLGSGL